MEYIIPNIKVNFSKIDEKDLIKSDNLPYLVKLGFNNYYSDNIKKLYDPKYEVKIRRQFKGKYKQYKISQPYNYTIQKNSQIDGDDKYDTIEEAFEKKYKYSSKKQDFYKLWEVITKYKVLGKNNYVNDEYGKKIIDINKKSESNKSYDALILNNHIKLNVSQEKMYDDIILDNIKLIKNLNNGGNMVLKLYTLYTQFTNDLIILLSQMFKKSIIYIPHTVETYKHEKYLVLLDYKPDKDILNLIDKMKGSYLSLNLENIDEYNKFVKELNLTESLKQAKAINSMEKYIKNNNYFGDDYEKYYKDAREKTKEWIKEFI